MTHQRKNMTIKTITKNIKENIQNSLVQFDINLSKEALNLSPPKQESFGDLSSNIALILAKQIKRNPLEIAEKVCQDLINSNIDYIDDITVTLPGFINFVIDKKFYQDNLKLIIKNGVEFGKDLSVKKRTANVEFVSANPTGPLTVGHGRNAVIGDTVSNILEWHGYDVTREYYYNDAGKQMRTLGKSVEARYYELLDKPFEFPEDGYQGDYIIEIAKSIIDHYGKELKKEDKKFLLYAEKIIFKQIPLNDLSFYGAAELAFKGWHAEAVPYTNEKKSIFSGVFSRLFK